MFVQMAQGLSSTATKEGAAVWSHREHDDFHDPGIAYIEACP
jgi:hypothetical protein